MKRLLGVALTALSLAAAPSAAQAGQYEVKACYSVPGQGLTHANASWAAEPDPRGYVAAYTHDCTRDGIVTRMSVTPPGQTDRAPWGVGARHVFTPPAGTRVVRFRATVDMLGTQGWAAGLVDATPRWVFCGTQCPGWGPPWYSIDLPLNTPQLFAQVTCGDVNGCPRRDLYAIAAMKDVIVTVQDDTPPNVAITGGSATTGGWHSGSVDVQYAANDATGIRAIDLLIDGERRNRAGGNCWDGWTRPCDDMSGTGYLVAPFTASDGRHVLSVQATDGGGNVASRQTEVLVDRTAPSQPLEVRLDEEARWRPRNDFAATWMNPPQSAAPIAAAHLRFCPAANDAGDLRGCSGPERHALHGAGAISRLHVPRPGDWRVLVWLEDEAGNADPATAVRVGGLGLDVAPPSPTILKPNEDDPARVRVAAADDISGVAEGQIEARRRGEDAWRGLRTTLDAKGFSAVMDDEALPEGKYELRARAIDRAGNERSTQLQENGKPAVRKLPLRLRTRLIVGKPKRIRARGSHGRKRYRTILVVKPRANYGRTIPLRGRLTTPGGNPLTGADIEVWQRIKLPNAAWRRMAAVRTSRTGRFRFKALRGPSRSLRFRYPGTATIRARSTTVELGVRARTSLRASRRSVVNGEDVTFRGRLKGRQFGNVGKLIYLQVYTRGRWSTFATPRANRATGRWNEPYRFTATRGRVRYRFRALVPREASYPYERGASHSVRVTVRGL